MKITFFSQTISVNIFLTLTIYIVHLNEDICSINIMYFLWIMASKKAKTNWLRQLWKELTDCQNLKTHASLVYLESNSKYNPLMRVSTWDICTYSHYLLLSKYSLTSTTQEQAATWWANSIPVFYCGTSSLFPGTLKGENGINEPCCVFVCEEYTLPHTPHFLISHSQTAKVRKIILHH